LLKRREDFASRTRAEKEQAQDDAITPDGRQVEVVANVGNLADVAAALEHGAEGIGLLRTEFLYLNRRSAPDEEEQMAVYSAILEQMGGRPVVVRTLDVGGDKELPYIEVAQEQNPFLGLRAIRISLAQPDYFRVQLRALLRVSPGHDLRIMFPMVSTIEEVRAAKSLLSEVREEVRGSGHAISEAIQVGIMVEVPSVALLADHFAAEVDFFSIGTNDLTQYTMAAERTNARVAHLNDPCHPAVLRQIRYVVEAAQQAGRWVGVCGEAAGDVVIVPILLGLGVDELSMAPASIPGVKALIRKWPILAARRIAEEALSMESASDVRRLANAHPITIGLS
jgi:phosphoenolpyruvate-protein phosphotransferase